ncbi:hypothetical protein CEB3_c12300 [Peptococcaceae bacterium CEB3]|nr:hypothetical protein CEB3_c12300 [Peptococcaceae bacterium CEB3]
MALPFRPPTDYYCGGLDQLDEEICALLSKRKQLSNDNPGYPGFDRIAAWSQKFGLNEDSLRRIFAVYILNEKRFQPPIQPEGFLKFIPILKCLETDDVRYAVSHMKQYKNASIVYVEIELKMDDPFVHLTHANIELSISPEYECRIRTGHGDMKSIQRSFVVVPALPDDVRGVEFCVTSKPAETPNFQEISLGEKSVLIM